MSRSAISSFSKAGNYRSLWLGSSFTERLGTDAYQDE